MVFLMGETGGVVTLLGGEEDFVESFGVEILFDRLPFKFFKLCHDVERCMGGTDAASFSLLN